MDGDPMPQTIVEKIAQMHMAEGPSRPLRTGDFLSIRPHRVMTRSEEHTSELQSPCNLVCRLLLEKKKKATPTARSATLAQFRLWFSSTSAPSTTGAWTAHRPLVANSVAPHCVSYTRDVVDRQIE